MAIVVFDFLEWTSINHRLITLETLPLFPFIGDYGYRPKFDAVNRLPGIFRALCNLDAVESGFLERLQELVLTKCPR